MALTFKVKQKIMGVGPKKGQTVYYAYQENHERLTPRQLEERIMRMTALSRADVHSALIAFSEVVIEEVMLGRAVDMGPLGLLKIVASGKMMDQERAVTAETINKPRIQFIPKQEMKQAAERVPLSVERARPASASGQGGPEGNQGSSSSGSGGSTPPSGGFDGH